MRFEVLTAVLLKIQVQCDATLCHWTGSYQHNKKRTRHMPEDCKSSYSIADMSLARPTSQCILFDGENISFDTSRVIYRYNPKHLYPKLNGYGDNGQRSLKV